jgi:hypothetical protein
VTDELRERLAIDGGALVVSPELESMQRIHISPAIGRRRIESVTRQEVERLGGSMLGRSLAPTTVRNVMTFLHAVFALALSNEWIKRNPVAGASRPKLRARGRQPGSSVLDRGTAGLGPRNVCGSASFIRAPAASLR